VLTAVPVCDSSRKATFQRSLGLGEVSFRPRRRNALRAAVASRRWSFYGTTNRGSAYGFGTVFRLKLVRTCASCRP